MSPPKGYLEPEGVWCFNAPAGDKSERKFLAKILKPGTVFWDIGANAGLYSMTALSYGCNVLAVEPHPEAFKQLAENYSHNYKDLSSQFPPQIFLMMNAAVGIENGRLGLDFSSRTNGASVSPYTSITTGSWNIVPSFTLSTLASVFAPPDVLKLDTNGFEPYTLEHATTILRFHPIILCKYDSQHPNLRPSSDLLELLPSYYTWRTLNGVDVKKHSSVLSPGSHQNLVAIPEGTPIDW